MLNLLNWCSNFLIFFSPIFYLFCSIFWDISLNLSSTFSIEFFIFVIRNVKNFILFLQRSFLILSYFYFVDAVSYFILRILLMFFLLKAV